MTFLNHVVLDGTTIIANEKTLNDGHAGPMPTTEIFVESHGE